MAEHGGKAPPKKGGEKKSGGGFWGFLGNVLSNMSVDINVGKPGRPGAPSRNPTDPHERMEPVHAERKEAYEETIYRKTEGAEGTAPAVRVDRDRQSIARSLDARAGAAADARVPQGGGSPLSKEVRAKMEPRLGGDLSGVRVHTAGESAAAAQDLSAKAFTVGSDVHFGSGQYQPGTKEGDRLIAHELTHVVQGQRSGVQRKSESDSDADGGPESGGHEVSNPSEPAEKEADAVADHVADDLHGGGEHAGAKEGAGAGEAKDGHGAKAGAAGTGKGVHAGASGQKHGKDAGKPNAHGDQHQAGSEGKSKAGQAGGSDKESKTPSEAKTPGAGGTAPASSSAAPPASGGSATASASAGTPSPSGGAGGASPSQQPVEVKQQAPAIGAKVDSRKLSRSPLSESATPVDAVSKRKIFRAGPGAPPKTTAPKSGPPAKPGQSAGQPAQQQKPPPTTLALGAATVQTSDMPKELELEAQKLAGARTIGNPGGDLVAAARAVEGKGGHQEGTTLTMPAVPASAAAGTIDGIANAIINSTGVSAVVVTKVGNDVQFEPQINPKAPPSLKLQVQTEQKASTLTDWWDKSKLSAKGVKNIDAWLSYWRTADGGYFVVADNRGNFALKGYANTPNPADLDDLKSAAQAKFGAVKAQWQQHLTDPGQMLSDLPATVAPKILDGYQSAPALQTAEDKARENLVAKLPTFHADKGPAGYKPVTKGDVEDAIKQGGRFRSDFLQQSGEGVAKSARDYALTKVDPAGPLKPKVDAGVHYDGAADDFGIVRVPKHDDANNHNYYFPRDIKRIPEKGLLADGTYQVVYKGYKNSTFTVTVGEGDMVKSIEGTALTMKVPGTRGVTQDTPDLAPKKGQELDRTHLIGDWFSGSGYKQSLNLVTCSKDYNRVTMGDVEEEIARFLKGNLTTRETEFTMKVDVEWATGKTPQEMVDQIVAVAGGTLSTQATKDETIKGLQTFLQANDKRRVVKAVHYTVTGMDKANKQFTRKFNAGPDIGFR